MAQAKRDENRVPTLLGVSSADLVTPTPIKVNPLTGAILTEGAALRSATLVVAASDSVDTTNADYVCDGTDDDVQIQDAIDALPAGGGRIILLEGNYSIGAAIDIAKSNVIIEGQGHSTILTLANAINTDVFTLGDGSSAYTNIQIKNLKIDGNLANQTTGGHGIDITATTTKVKVSNCWIINTYNANIYVFNANCTYCEFTDNYLDTTKSGGQYANIEGGGNYTKAINNICVAGDYGNINLYNGTSHLVSHNTCINGGSNGEAILVGQNSNVSDNMVINSSDDSISTIGDYTTISNNIVYTFSGTTSIPINIVGNKCSVIGNIIYLTSASNIKAIMLAGTNSTVTGNSINMAGSGDHIGIYIYAAGCVVRDNNLYTNSSSTSEIGINVRGTFAVVGSNHIEGFGTGINFVTGDNSAVDGNVIQNSGIGINAGVNLDCLTIKNNVLVASSTSTVGIKCGGSSAASNNVQVVNNFVQAFDQSGIEMYGSNEGIISGNQVVDCGGAGRDSLIYLAVTGAAYSTYNVISGNQLNQGNHTVAYGIRENSASDGPNIVTNNMVKDATTKISTQHVNTDVSHNITS